MTLSSSESALLRLADIPSDATAAVISSCTASNEILTSDFAKSILNLTYSTKDGLRVGVTLQQSSEELLALGVALLNAYVQVNWTGPALELSPLDLFPVTTRESGEAITHDELNEHAIDSLAYCGEPVYHLSRSTTFLSLALQIFGLIPSPFAEENKVKTEGPYGVEWQLESIKIWRLRAGLVWIKVLDEPVPLPLYIPTQAIALRSTLPPTSFDRAQLSLSLSLLGSLLSRSSPHSSAQKEASTLAADAAKEEGLEWELTGRLGKKTKWQRDEKTQLVVLARDKSDTPLAKSTAIVPTGFDLNDDTILERTAFTTTTVIPTTALDSLDPSDQPSISPFSQAILLSLSISTLSQATSLINLHSDILSTAQVSAFVARVLIDPQNWSVHSMGLLLRCRAEAGRSRTVERGVLQMQALVDQLKDGSPTEISALSSAVKKEDVAEARDRLSLFYSLALPAAWELERELATRYLSLGVSRSALEIFTRLEMWEEVAKCYVSLEQPEKGVEVIKDLLAGSRAESELVMLGRKGEGARTFRGGEKREAKLWCTLGELENEPAHYEKAWIVSHKTSSRAQRSLGAVHWAHGEWAKARVALRLALAINPLFARTWFVLGCCEMRLDDWTGAQEAFGRCVALEDEDGESWSNLASCHLRRGESEGDARRAAVAGFDDEDEEDDEIDSTGLVTAKLNSTVIEDDQDAIQKLPFSRKRAAFHCLRQAIKHSYESWRVWMNYMVVAVDVGEMNEACRALGRIVEMRGEKDGEDAVDLDVLERLVNAVTRGDEEEEEGQSYGGNPNGGKKLATRVEQLITKEILPRISNSPRIFLAYARLCIYSNDFSGALDAHLKAYRAGIVGDATIEHDRKKFSDAAASVEEVVGMLENLGPKLGKDGEMVAKDWKYQAKSIVRTFLSRTKSAFEDEPEYERLKELALELK